MLVSAQAVPYLFWHERGRTFAPSIVNGCKAASSSTTVSFDMRPMKRVALYIVFRGELSRNGSASSPTRSRPSFRNATTDGVVFLPNSFGMTSTLPLRITAITENVVPRSMPTVCARPLKPSALRAEAPTTANIPRLKSMLPALTASLVGTLLRVVSRRPLPFLPIISYGPMLFRAVVSQIDC